MSMTKLNKRQIVILALMALAVIYGIYEIIFGSPAGNKAATIKTYNSAINSNVAAVSLNNPLERLDAYIIGRAKADWKSNPFLERKLYKEWTAKEEPAGASNIAVKFIYSGYVDAGKKKMAIINGMEYGEGEKLGIEGYVLKNITPAKIKIENRKTGSELEISLQE
jgi:hypothetical protein